MSMGVRVGVVPTSSRGSSTAGGRRAGSSSGCGTDSDSDYEGDGDGDSRTNKVGKAGPPGPGSAAKSSNFLQIPVKNAELKEKLRVLGAANRSSDARGSGGAAAAAATTDTSTASARGGVGAGSGTRASFVLPSQRRKQEQRDQRRSSVLLSLAMLDVTDDDDHDDHYDSLRGNDAVSADSSSHAEALGKAPAGAPLQPSEPKGRYLRRGSVTKHQLVPNVDAMQPSLRTPRAAAPYVPNSDIPARADFEHDETDFSGNGYASDSYGYSSDASVSNSYSAMSHKRRQSAAAVPGNATTPPLTSQNAQSNTRLLRGGSVTRHKSNPPVGSMPQTPHRRSLVHKHATAHGDDGYNEDDASVTSMPPLSSSAASSQSANALPPRQKYNRRGSVTKFSLDSYLQNPSHTKGLQGEGKQSSASVDYGYNDDNDNTSVVSMPPLSSSAASSQSATGSALPPRQKYNRRGSVTKFSLDSYLQNPTHTKSLQGEGKQSSASVDYGYNDDNDNASVVSMPALSSSASSSQSASALPPRQKYHRRGSVTKFSLDSYLQNPTHTKGLQGEGKQSSASVDYGYNDDNDNASVVSMPPLSSSASSSQSASALPPRQKYHRRGSVTKFSLDPSQASHSNSAALQPSGDKRTNQDVPLAAQSNHNDCDSENDSENETRPKPKPGDDEYSENLENSGRYSRRSISISMETDDDEPSSTFTDSKRPPIPRSHSASSATQSKKPPKKLAVPRDGQRNGALDPNHMKIRMTNAQQSPLRPTNHHVKSVLEDDSGHVKKLWYSQSPVTRRDSMSSLDSESSDTEFGAEIVDSQPKQRSPPRLPPHKPRVEAPRPDDSTSSHPRKPATGKTTIDGNLLNLASSSFDDVASNSGLSDDDDANILPLRKKQLRGRRSSIVGIPSSDSGSPPLDDALSHVHHDEGLPTPKPTKMRARRTSIVGIPTMDPPSPPPNSLSTDDAFEKSSNTKPTSSGIQETAKAKKKSTTKTKSSTKDKKSMATAVTTSERRGCLKESDATGMPKKVRFGHLVITEFPIILGDNPAVTSGAPVTIDWSPQKETRLSINAYEQCKPRRRRRRKLLISVSNRAILLLAAGYTIDEIADASIDAQQIKLGRQQTLDNQSWDRINHMLESTGDAIGGIFLQPLQSTGKKLKSLVVKPQQHSASARMA